MRMIRLAGMMALFSRVAFGRESQVYLDQFSLLRGQPDSLFKELSDRDTKKEYPPGEFMNQVLTEPSNRLRAVILSVDTLDETILKSCKDGSGKKGDAGEMVRLRYLMYACSSLSSMLDALQSFVMYFGTDRTWLDLATAQKVPINSALKFLAQVKP